MSDLVWHFLERGCGLSRVFGRAVMFAVLSGAHYLIMSQYKTSLIIFQLRDKQIKIIVLSINLTFCDFFKFIGRAVKKFFLLTYTNLNQKSKIF